MANEIDVNALIGKWVHAHEEDAPGITVYKPSGTPLPISRNRESIEFLKTGQFNGFGIGADDRVTVNAATWKVDPGTGQLKIVNPDQDGITIDIVSVDAEKLVIRKSAE